MSLKLKHPAPAMLAVLGMFVTSILPKSPMISAARQTLEEKIKNLIDKPSAPGRS